MTKLAIFAAVLALTGCDSGEIGPERCGSNTCNEVNAGGTCDDSSLAPPSPVLARTSQPPSSSGSVICTCNPGYTGSGCADCEDGYQEADGACLPADCGDDTCNESHGGGSCDDSSGWAECTCNQGYIGPSCRQCVAGYKPDGSGGCDPLAAPACDPLPGVRRERFRRQC